LGASLVKLIYLTPADEQKRLYSNNSLLKLREDGQDTHKEAQVGKAGKDVRQYLLAQKLYPYLSELCSRRAHDENTELGTAHFFILFLHCHLPQVLFKR
jgi:hypothetical protein